MEELRSTDILDQEIKADVKKKADRILEDARQTAQSLEAGVTSRVSAAGDEAKKSSEARIGFYEKNINASLPLEKQRYFVSFVNSEVIGAFNSYFKDLGPAKRLDIVKKLVERSKDELKGKNVNAFVIGFNKADAEKMLKSQFGSSLLSCKAGNEIMVADEAVEGFEFREGLVLVSEDGKTVCRLTLDEKLKEVLDSKSYELSSALFAGRLPE
jgi:V/A-type H+-transporting ATPase subunit E